MSLKKLKKRLLKNKDFLKEYYTHDIASEIADMVFRARISRRISQEKLSRLIGTKQSSIARLEAGKSLPSLRFLEKIAVALDTRLVAPKFELLEDASSANLIFNNDWFFQSEVSRRPANTFVSPSYSEDKIFEMVKSLNFSNR